MKNKDSGFRVVGSVFLLLFFSFHSTFDVGRSMFDVHLLIRSMFIFSVPPGQKQLGAYGIGHPNAL